MGSVIVGGARCSDDVEVGTDSSVQRQPGDALRRALARTRLSVADPDRIEINDRASVHDGEVASGHPRILTVPPA